MSSFQNFEAGAANKKSAGFSKLRSMQFFETALRAVLIK